MQKKTVLIVEDNRQFHEEISKAAQRSQKFEFIHCIGLFDAIKAIQSAPKIDIAIVDLHFDYNHNEDGQLELGGHYGWILIPLIYEYHPSCKITLNSSSAFVRDTVIVSLVNYRVANICSKDDNPVTGDLHKVLSRNSFDLPPTYQNMVNEYKRSMGKAIMTQNDGLGFMDAVILELAFRTELDSIHSKNTPQFQYWKCLQIGKNNKEMMDREHIKKRIRKIKTFLFDRNLLSKSEADSPLAYTFMRQRLCDNNLLIKFNNIGFCRIKDDEKILIASAEGRICGTQMRPAPVCIAIIGISQQKAFTYIEQFHKDIFPDRAKPQYIPKKRDLAIELCNHLSINYDKTLNIN